MSETQEGTMTGPSRKLIAAAEAYFADLRRVRASGGGTGERSYYPALANLLTAVGRGLKPKVFCVLEGADQGAGHPDFALYTASQVQKGRPREGQVPERGVVEVKGVVDDAWLTTKSNQVSRYWGRYRLVLVTNLRDFVLVGTDGTGSPAKLETLRLAEDADRLLEQGGRSPAPSPAKSALASASTFLVHSRTGPPWPSRRIWRGFSLLMPATAWPVSRWRETRRRS